MKQSTRGFLAYTMGNLANHSQNASPVYDYEAGRFASIAGSVDAFQVQIFDYESGDQFGGTNASGTFNLLHYGAGTLVTLTVGGDGSFSGYDFDTGCLYTCTVIGGTISLYDYGDEGGHHLFMI